MKILLIRFSSIGDIVLTTPVIRCVKQQLSGAEVHFLTKKKFVAVTEANPYINKFHYLEEGNLHALTSDLQKEKFDRIADLQGSLRSRYIRTMLRLPSDTFPKLNREKWLLTNLHINRMPDVHVVDRYFSTVEKLGVVNDGKGLDYFIPETVSSQYNLPPSPYIVFAIGGTYATKRLPDTKITDICRRITAPIMLIGGKEDASSGQKIAALAGRDKVTNLCGQVNLHQSALLIKHAACIITHDTGMMHIAAAFKKKVISVWGNTVPEFGMYPYLPGSGSYIAEVKGLPCRPCSKLGHPHCPKKHFYCMNLQETDTIAARAMEGLRQDV